MARDPKAPRTSNVSSGFAEQPQAHFKIELPPIRHHQPPPGGRFKVGAGGRIVIPADIRELLGVKEGDVLLGRFENGRLSLASVATVVAEVQAKLDFKPGEPSMVDELIAERRAEAARDDEESGLL